MAEHQTWAEARHQQRMCDGDGYRNGAPLCPGRAVKRSPQGGEQLCQRHLAARKLTPARDPKEGE